MSFKEQNIFAASFYEKALKHITKSTFPYPTTPGGGKTSYFRNLICGFFYMVKNERKVTGKPFLDFLMMFNNKCTLNIDNLRLLKDISSDND